jgi:hypothetical protein
MASGRWQGSSHITYGEPPLVRLTTDAPLSYIQQETPFALTRPLHMVFGPDEPFMGDITSTVRDFQERTRSYWLEWVRRLSIAYEWQEASIRAAITLKLTTFEETGGIVAALTTSCRKRRIRGATGTIAIAGCATPILW